MNINFFYSGDFIFDHSAMSKRLVLYSKALKLESCDVQIFSLWKYKSQTKRVENFDLNIYRIKKFNYLNFPLLNSINNFISVIFYLFILFSRIQKKSSLVLIGSNWYTIYLYSFIFKLKQVKIILEVNENPYSPERGRTDLLLFRKIYNFLTLSFSYKFVSGFIVISSNLQELVKQNCRNFAKTVKIPILIDTDKNNYDFDIIDIEKFKPYIIHPGALSETKDGILAVVKSFILASKISKKKIYFLYTAQNIKPSLKDEIFSLLEENNLSERFICVGKLLDKELKYLIIKSSLSIINKPNNWQNNYNFPTKVGELLQLGTPLIVSKTGELLKYFKNHYNSILVEPNNCNEIADAIIYILDNPMFSELISKNGRELAYKEFDYKLYSKKMYNFFDSIQSNS